MDDKKTTRAFVCIDFPDEVVREVARVQELVGKRPLTGKFTELENLHLTLKFLGEVDDEKLEEVRKRLREIKLSAFEAKLSDLGTFSYRGIPRIVWIKVNGMGVHALQKNVDSVLNGLFEPEERFMSHLTIARLKYVKDLKGFYDALKNITVEPLKFQVKEFRLMKSELKPMGSVYTEIEKYELKKEN